MVFVSFALAPARLFVRARNRFYSVISKGPLMTIDQNSDPFSFIRPVLFLRNYFHQLSRQGTIDIFFAGILNMWSVYVCERCLRFVLCICVW